MYDSIKRREKMACITFKTDELHDIMIGNKSDYMNCWSS
jgi:hypothetical protein